MCLKMKVWRGWRDLQQKTAWEAAEIEGTTQEEAISICRVLVTLPAISPDGEHEISWQSCRSLLLSETSVILQWGASLGCQEGRVRGEELQGCARKGCPYPHCSYGVTSFSFLNRARLAPTGTACCCCH